MYRVIQRSALAAAATSISIMAWFSPARAQITVAAAASSRFAMEDIRSGFRRTTGLEAKAVYGASGRLTAQIKSGAPFDVFVSADLAYPDSLLAWGQASGKVETYAFGKLVLWSATGLDPEKGMAILIDPAVARIALADPRSAPYGREAVKAMQRSGVYGKVSSKLVYGESISQVSQYILTGNVQVGLSALSVVLSEKVALSESAQGKGKWKELDAALYDPIAQGAVITRFGRDEHPAEAARFFAYLRSDSARAILAEYGYGLP